MTRRELVSILIPVYNREKLIQETIESALSQTYSNIEVIVVDNCSTDNTFSLLKKYSAKDNRLKVYQNDSNIGPVRNWRKALDLATGTFAKILWSDDLITKDFVEKTIPYFDNPEVGFVYTKAKIFDSSKNEIAVIHTGLSTSGVFKVSEYIDRILFGYPFSGSVPYSPGCAIFRKDVLNKSLRVDIPNKLDIDFAKLAIGNDLLTFLLATLDYKQFGFVNESLSLFREHNESISNNSGGEKLELYYNVAKSYFISRYKKEFLNKYNGVLKATLYKYKNNKYGFRSLNDFYPEDIHITNTNYSRTQSFLTVISWFLKR
jgi:glycosyltransferase involved in cell wall biosynthesis